MCSYLCSSFVSSFGESTLGSVGFFLSFVGGFPPFLVPTTGVVVGAGFLTYPGFGFVTTGVLGLWVVGFPCSTFSWLACSFFSSWDYSPSFFSSWLGFFSTTTLLLLRLVVLTLPPVVDFVFPSLLAGRWSRLLKSLPLFRFGEATPLLLTTGVLLPVGFGFSGFDS